MNTAAFANTATQEKPASSAMFACAAMTVSAILIIRTLSLPLSVLLVAVLCSLLISLVLRISRTLSEHDG